MGHYWILELAALGMTPEWLEGVLGGVWVWQTWQGCIIGIAWIQVTFILSQFCVRKYSKPHEREILCEMFVRQL